MLRSRVGISKQLCAGEAEAIYQKLMLTRTTQLRIEAGCGNTVQNMVCPPFRVHIHQIHLVDVGCFMNLGFYQRGDPGNLRSIETAFLSLSLFQSQCNQAFPFPNLLPASPNIQHVNKYGGWNMNPSNVFWTNGECECSMRLISHTARWHREFDHHDSERK